MEACISQFDALPAFDNELWVDGNSKTCRVLHAVYARQNTLHCPHVSFAAEVDSNGLKRCYNSELLGAADFFTEEEIAGYQATTLPYTSSNPYLAAHPSGSCPLF